MPEPIGQAQRMVIKLGTQIVIEDGALARERLGGLVAQCAALIRQGREVLLVSSGAVGLGKQELQLKTGAAPLSLADKQACAAVGQNLLMDVYRELFGTHDLITAQVLLTASDFADRKRYLNLRETLERLLQLGVVPIINENDTVSTMELVEDRQGKGFGDNDKLSALIASKLDANLLVILTNVSGIYTDNPVENAAAQLVPVIDGFEQLNAIRAHGQSSQGRGGMSTKLEAARIAALSGVHTFVTSGLRENALLDIPTLSEDSGHAGTLVLARNTLPGKKRWIGLASGYSGIVVVNEGARKALIENRASLLPIGIVDVLGEFATGQVVSIQDEQGTDVGRGIIHFSSQETRKIKGQKSREIPKILGSGHDATDNVVIHRDNLVIFQEYYV